MALFEKKKANPFAKKATPPPPELARVAADSVMAAQYKVDDGLSKIKTSKVTSTPPKLLKIIKNIKEGPDGTTHTLEFHIWDTLSRVYLINSITPGLHRVVLSCELGHDNLDMNKRRSYLRWLAKVMPQMLAVLAQESEE